MANKLFISGAHGSGCSLLKSLCTGKITIDPNFATCHASWHVNQTQSQYSVSFNHNPYIDYIKKTWNPDITIWLQIHPEDIAFICKRIVILDFLYTNDSEWVAKDWCWTRQKHQRLAGPDWPDYSEKIQDYPTWCLDKMCQVAWERSRLWTEPNDNFDFTIYTTEIFGYAKRSTLQECFSALGFAVDHSAIDQWRDKNIEVCSRYLPMFTWEPGWQTPEDWISGEYIP